MPILSSFMIQKLAVQRCGEAILGRKAMVMELPGKSGKTWEGTVSQPEGRSSMGLGRYVNLGQHALRDD